MRWMGRLLIGALLMALPGLGGAYTVRSGYFQGYEFTAIGGADESLLEVVPAACVIFTFRDENMENLQKFEEWYRQPRDYDYPVYGIMVVGASTPADLNAEVLRQQGITFPLFTTRFDILEGKRLRVALISGSRAVDIRVDGARITEQMNRIAERAGLRPSDGLAESHAGVFSPAETTATARARRRPAKYINSRYGFTARFPSGVEYKVSRTKDGAVTSGTPDSSLVYRAWGEEAAEALMTEDAANSPAEYIKLHLDLLAEEAEGEVKVDGKFVVRDELGEGRDYRYSWTTPKDRGGKKMRGRIQVFAQNGVFKAAAVEGPAADFQKATSRIDQFMEAFLPTAE